MLGNPLPTTYRIVRLLVIKPVAVVDSYPRIGNCHSETMQLPFDDWKQPSVAIDSSIGSLLMGLSLPKGRSFHSVGRPED
jgi:hypothetical protein